MTRSRNWKKTHPGKTRKRSEPVPVVLLDVGGIRDPATAAAAFGQDAAFDLLVALCSEPPGTWDAWTQRTLEELARVLPVRDFDGAEVAFLTGLRVKLTVRAARLLGG